MKDTIGRDIDYMRISITDRCNLRCVYCMPNGVELISMKELLTYEEILEVCRQAVELGIVKFKITGGEPLVRLGCCDLIRQIKAIPKVEQVTITTNGTLLEKYMDELCAAQVDGVNVSLDTMKPELFQKITGFDQLDQVLSGIYEAERRGLRVKVNAVLQKGVNDGEWKDLINLGKDHRIDVRFIELMPIGEGGNGNGVSEKELLDRIKEVYPNVTTDHSIHGNGPAVYYHIPGFVGSVGFISAIHGVFCGSCNRIRMTSTGDLKPCLCYQDSLPLREFLRNGQKEKVRGQIAKAILGKPKMHCFDQKNNITERKMMAQIGG